MKLQKKPRERRVTNVKRNNDDKIKALCNPGKNGRHESLMKQ